MGLCTSFGARRSSEVWNTNTPIDLQRLTTGLMRFACRSVFDWIAMIWCSDDAIVMCTTQRNSQVSELLETADSDSAGLGASAGSEVRGRTQES
jgi:hypothetical protein